MDTQKLIAIDASNKRCFINGNWITPNLSTLRDEIRETLSVDQEIVLIDAAKLQALDTSGALVLCNLIHELEKNNKSVFLENLKTEFHQLYNLVEHRLKNQPVHQLTKKLSLLEDIGQKTWIHFEQGYLLLTFVGELTVFLYQSLLNPLKIRWRIVLGQIEETGVNAIPIVALLTFLLGIVIGYQGGVQLEDFGANIFVVELVSLTMLRELAPMMTAVIVAARSGSAFTAQIGTMKVTEEVSAMQTMGMSPMDILVLPRMLALFIALPLLTVFADIMGVLGGMVMAATMLNVSFFDFLQRLPEAVSLTSFFIGVGKAPVFALIIAVVGCYQGFQVSGSGESVGRQTTISVVQAIFILIVADAIFSIVFSIMGI